MMLAVLQLISMQMKLIMNTFVGRLWVFKKDHLMAFVANLHLIAYIHVEGISILSP